MAQTVSNQAIDEKIEELVKNHTQLSRTLQKKLGLTASAVSILELLEEKHLSLKQLTDYSVLDKSTLSRQVNQLVKKDMVKRETGKDKRFVKFSATEKGRELYQQYNLEKDNKINSILISWTEEEKQLLYVLLGRMGRSLKQSL